MVVISYKICNTNFGSFQIVALPRLENLNVIMNIQSAWMKTEWRSVAIFLSILYRRK